ncbi:Protein mono-ADP-ribosyltransferase parp14 [Bulinus truncatus]|nr:Protein mono-ADP-ribosyltransferase parp14 [Bulinus truncatus]
MVDKIGVTDLHLCYFGIQEFFQHDEGKQMRKKIEDEFRCTIKADLKAGYVFKTSQSEWNFGNIAVNLVEDEINKQTTDVVVNSVDNSLDLKNGRLTAVILKEAGDQIQTELKIRYGKGINPGEFAVSTAGKMKCKHIFHACLTVYKGKNNTKMKSLIRKMLERADELKAKSISFPALGTGNLNYPPDLSCKVILESISEYSNQNPYSHLDHVNIVIYPKDKNVSQAFKTVFFASTNGSGDGLHDYYGDIDDVYLYGNLCLKIKQGDITKEKKDVIIISIKESMDLSKSGCVCRALLNNCGQELQDECYTKKDKMALNGTVVTSASKLPCKNIIFLSQDKFGDCWDKGILKALMEAEKIGATSLALPALGAESLEDDADVRAVVESDVEAVDETVVETGIGEGGEVIVEIFAVHFLAALASFFCSLCFLVEKANKNVETVFYGTCLGACYVSCVPPPQHSSVCPTLRASPSSQRLGVALQVKTISASNKTIQPPPPPPPTRFIGPRHTRLKAECLSAGRDMACRVNLAPSNARAGRRPRITSPRPHVLSPPGTDFLGAVRAAILTGLLLLSCGQFRQTAVDALSCEPCEEATCTNATGCPGGTVLGPCRCCLECARQVNQTCGGMYDLAGTCDHNLICVVPVSEDAGADDSQEGICMGK